MRWQGRRKSSHVEDRRGTRISAGRGSRGGGAMAGVMMMLFRKTSGKTRIVIILAAIIGCFVFKINPMSLLGFSSGGNQQVVTQTSAAPDDEMGEYLATMKADNEDVWKKILASEGIQYRPSKMIIYTDRVMTGGGVADANMGPFYSPSDEAVYIDPTFFTEMKEKFNAQGDFAEAYVIAHEVAHHIQNILGETNKLHGKAGKVSKQEYNQLSVRLELQADFLAGVFAHHAQEEFNFLEDGDIEEAMKCAEAIGDDRLQKEFTGQVQPDLFTHGTSAQRKRWFMKGYETGDIRQRDTFSIPYNSL
ncbi:MAG: KPN_02809 family neutral zinc metallopeptidase [Akkermansiaceae bacterium]